MTSPVSPSDARKRRVNLEEDLRSRWRALCQGAGTTLVDLSERHLGISRSDLYASFDGGPSAPHPRAAWLELLPRQAERAWLVERALVHGCELAPVSGTHATLADVVARAGGALAQLAASEADGHLSPAEAQTDLAAIERLEEVLARAKATRRAAIERRGMRVAGGGSAR